MQRGDTESRGSRVTASEKHEQRKRQHHPLHQSGMWGKCDHVQDGLTPSHVSEPRSFCLYTMRTCFEVDHWRSKKFTSKAGDEDDTTSPHSPSCCFFGVQPCSRAPSHLLTKKQWMEKSYGRQNSERKRTLPKGRSRSSSRSTSRTLAPIHLVTIGVLPNITQPKKAAVTATIVLFCMLRRVTSQTRNHRKMDRQEKAENECDRPRSSSSPRGSGGKNTSKGRKPREHAHQETLLESINGHLASPRMPNVPKKNGKMCFPKCEEKSHQLDKRSKREGVSGKRDLVSLCGM